MVSTPHGKDLNEDNGTSSKKKKHEEFIKFRKESSSKKVIKQGEKKIHQKERFWESIKLWGKKKEEKVIKLEKAPTKRKKNKKRWECKNFHQVERNNDLFKRHMRHEIP